MQGIRLKKFVLSGRQLSEMDENERVLFVQLSHVGNSIGILQKWMLFLMSEESEDPQYLGALTQQMLVMRVLAGTLSESWQMLRKSFFGTELSRRYEPLLDPESKHGISCFYIGTGACILELERSTVALGKASSLLPSQLHGLREQYRSHAFDHPAWHRSGRQTRWIPCGAGQVVR